MIPKELERKPLNPNTATEIEELSAAMYGWGGPLGDSIFVGRRLKSDGFLAAMEAVDAMRPLKDQESE